MDGFGRRNHGYAFGWHLRSSSIYRSEKAEGYHIGISRVGMQHISNKLSISHFTLSFSIDPFHMCALKASDFSSRCSGVLSFVYPFGG
jgi:hypothetical protein